MHYHEETNRKYYKHEMFLLCCNYRIVSSFRFPAGRPLDNVKLGFFQSSNIPNIVGAVDGTLIPIIAPTENEEIYVCRKNYHAINVQAVVDHRGM